MIGESRIAVVVPAHNEELLIGQVITTMPAFVDQVIVVDDASSDGTAAAIQAHEEALGARLTFIQLPVNGGVGEAIVAGYRRALEDGNDVIAVMGGDAQMDPAELQRIVGPVVEGKCEYAKGNRFFWSETFAVMPRHRFLGNVGLSLLSKISSGYWHIADFQSGYTAISAPVLRELLEWKLYPRYGFPNDLLVKLNVLQARVADVPIRSIYRNGERSGIRVWKVMPRISKLLLKGFWWRMWNKYVVRFFHPLVFFYALAAVLLPASSLAGAALIGYRIIEGPVEATSALFVGFLFVTGIQFLLFAMWFDQAQNEKLAPDYAVWRELMTPAARRPSSDS